MINGTKLLNVAGMTRGRRDGILKSEKIRHVVKIGPMHLKGVWIPYERALDFANKEKITELLYPLFVHNIGALLYHPTNQNRTSQVMAAAERRKAEQSQMRTPPAGLPSIQQHQSHSMALPGPQPSLPSNNMGRPSLDRAHTFPTPPTSASSVMASMGSSDNFGWQGQALNGSQSTNSMNMETGLNTARSMPNTPATTPPGSMQPYQPGAHAYDNSRQLYNPPSTQQSPYHNANGSQERLYSQNNPYPKSEMGPPTSRPGASAAPGEHHDSKPANGVLPSENTTQAHNGEEEGDHEHDPEYTHDNGGYDGNRPSYNYTAPGVGALTGDNNINPEMTGSPNHQGHSGRATPRSAAPQQSYYPQNTGYGTPPRVQPPTSNLYSVMSNDRPQTNGASGNDVYAPPADMGNSMQNGYAPHPPVLNGSIGAMKRGRDDDDDLPRPGGDGHGAMAGLDLKRRKTMESSVPAPTYDAMSRPTSAISGGPRR
jgi:protein SOK2